MLITPLMNKIENYVPKLRGGTSKVQECQGKKSIFMSTYSGNLRQLELGEEDRTPALLQLYECVPQGEVDLFWTRISLDMSERVEGILTLLDELSTYKKQLHPLSTNRCPKACVYKVSFSYRVTFYFDSERPM